MADRFVELTRIDHNARGEPALVNLDNVAWVQPNDDGTTWIVFAAAVPHERANGVPLSISVRETLEDLVRLIGVTRKTDRDAIAQAWLDQQARRDVGDDGDRGGCDRDERDRGERDRDERDRGGRDRGGRDRDAPGR